MKALPTATVGQACLVMVAYKGSLPKECPLRVQQVSWISFLKVATINDSFNYSKGRRMPCHTIGSAEAWPSPPFHQTILSFSCIIAILIEFLLFGKTIKIMTLLLQPTWLGDSILPICRMIPCRFFTKQIKKQTK